MVAARNYLAPVLGHFEPEMRITPLCRCPECHAPHPRAQRPAIDSDDCVECGARCETGATIIETAALTGLWSLVPRAFFVIGRFLSNLARSL